MRTDTAVSKDSQTEQIKQLYHPDRSPTDEELNLAALQFIRKVTGYRVPSRANQEAFDKAVAEITAL